MAREQTKMITSIGGQALMEGVMMRGPKKTSVAVRLPDETIDVEELKIKSLRERYKWLNWPFIRGVIAMYESMTIGFKALGMSADKSLPEDEEEAEPSKFDQWMTRVFGENAMNYLMVIAGTLGVLIAIGLFFFLPALSFNLIYNYTGIGDGFLPWRSTFEGVIRILIFIAYIGICSLIPSVKRVFQYHGAEHKTIFCYENKEELTVENVRKHSRFHPRCGTSFLVLMLIVGIVVGFFIPFENPFLRTSAKLLLLPVSVSIGFELIKICSKYDNIITRIVAAPGLWMQRITVKEPDDGMIEVAIAAMKDVIPEKGEDIICGRCK